MKGSVFPGCHYRFSEGASATVERAVTPKVITLEERGHETITATAQPVQGALFEAASPTRKTGGFRGTAVSQITDISYQQIDHRPRTGLVASSIASAEGSGSHRFHSFRDLLLIKTIKALIDVGISLQNVRNAVDHLAARGVEDLPGLTPMSDGVSVYKCRSADDVTDLLAGDQGVFGPAVPGLVKDLSVSPPPGGPSRPVPEQRATTPCASD